MGRLATRILALSPIVDIPIYLRYGTVSPCGIVRVQAREATRQEGGPAGALASVVPDSVIDSYLLTNYHELNPGRCIAIALVQANASTPIRGVRPDPAPVQSRIPASQAQLSPQLYKTLALADFMVASRECRNKRLSGELQGFEEAALCVKHRIMPQFAQMRYNHMDLLEQFLDARTDVARKIDQGWLTETEGGQEVKRLAEEWGNKERFLDTGQ